MTDHAVTPGGWGNPLAALDALVAERDNAVALCEAATRDANAAEAERDEALRKLGLRDARVTQRIVEIRSRVKVVERERDEARKRVLALTTEAESIHNIVQMMDRDEMVCDRCHRRHGVVWHADPDLWNAVMREGDRGKPDEFSFCCPTCFMQLATERGHCTFFAVTGASYDEEDTDE